MGTTALNNIFARMGASPVFLPGGEVYESAKRGIIDAFEYVTPSVNWSLGFQEVAHYLYLSPSRAPSDAFALFVNKDVWNALPLDLQKIVEMVTHEVTRRFYLESILKDSIALEKFKEYGTIIEKVPNDINELLYKEANEYYTEECAKDSNYKKVYEAAVKFREICNQAGIK
jgi:TRAP-type mannitol/chloroaromatic compound transport system substrate-binding protein